MIQTATERHTLDNKHDSDTPTPQLEYKLTYTQTREVTYRHLEQPNRASPFVDQLARLMYPANQGNFPSLPGWIYGNALAYDDPSSVRWKWMWMDG